MKRARGSARMARLALVGTVFVAGCGDKDADTPIVTTTTSGPSTSASTSDSITALIAGTTLDPTVALGLLCGNWTLGHPDRWILNMYVWDLLAPLELVNSANPPPFDTPDIDRAVEAACKDHPQDPEAFVRAIAADLGLTMNDVIDRVALACARYRVQQERIAEGDWSGFDVDPQVIAIGERAGMSEHQLRQGIESSCTALGSPGD